jgi:cytochrome c-type biogenesis protein
MSVAPGVAVAFAAGVLSFASPCTLPLVPGYLAVIADRRPGQASAPRTATVLRRGLAFTAAFSAIFVLAGLTATALGALLRDRRGVLEGAAGMVIVVMGSWLLVTARWPRLGLRGGAAGRLVAAVGGHSALAGAAFAFAWTPCVGPALGAILALSATQRGVTTGGGLLCAYAAGMALPLLACAAALDRGSRRLAGLRRHGGRVQALAGALLLATGMLVVSGHLFLLDSQAQHLLDALGLGGWGDA